MNELTIDLTTISPTKNLIEKFPALNDVWEHLTIWEKGMLADFVEDPDALQPGSYFYQLTMLLAYRYDLKEIIDAWEKLYIGDDIKACPFCGSKEITSHVIGDGKVYLTCDVCGIETDVSRTLNIAKTKWNRRVD